MNVLFLSPGYPSEMPEFVRGLSEMGARVWGVGDSAPGDLPATARHHLSGYLRVPSLGDESAVVDAVRGWLRGQSVDRVEALGEYWVVLAGRLREALGVPGMGAVHARVFRDKEAMKQVLDAAGVRTPRHFRARTVSEVWAAAERVGFPLIVKPIDGAGSANTFRCDDAASLQRALARTTAVPQVSVEEFIDGQEFTFDTLTCRGEIRYFNIAWYRPRPLIARQNEWISPQVIALRDVHAAELQGGVAMGKAVIGALGFSDGFTHMEWYRKASGEVVFGEIGARPPGARQVDQMNYACDFDSFREWARIVCYGEMSATIHRKYNVATIFKRAQGQGRITHIEGADRLRREFGSALVWDNLLPVGAHRRDWLQTLVSDGFWVLRHPELGETVRMADRVGSELQMFAQMV
jgi:hypothetical protein